MYFRFSAWGGQYSSAPLPTRVLGKCSWKQTEGKVFLRVAEREFAIDWSTNYMNMFVWNQKSKGFPTFHVLLNGKTIELWRLEKHDSARSINLCQSAPQYTTRSPTRATMIDLSAFLRNPSFSASVAFLLSRVPHLRPFYSSAWFLTDPSWQSRACLRSRLFGHRLTDRIWCEISAYKVDSTTSGNIKLRQIAFFWSETPPHRQFPTLVEQDCDGSSLKAP